MVGTKVLVHSHVKKHGIVICCGSKNFDKEQLTPLLSIGQMIELLIEKAGHFESDPYPTLTFCKPGDEHSEDCLEIGLFWGGRREGKEFCDALWEAVKATL